MADGNTATGQVPGGQNQERPRRKQEQALAEEELRWYYQSSDSALGERSTWEAMVLAAQIGGGLGGARRIDLIAGEPTHPGPTEGQVWAANRQTRIRRRLGKLSRRQQAVIEASFKIRRQDKQLKGLFGERAEPVVTYLRRLGLLKIRRDGDANDRELIRTQALSMLDGAIGAFMATRDAPWRPQRRQAPPAQATVRRPPRRRSERQAIVGGLRDLLPAMREHASGLVAA